MENNLENKAKFYSLYGMVRVSRIGNTKDLIEPIIPVADYLDGDEGFLHDSYLELKSLDSISDKDLVACYHLGCSIAAYDYSMDFEPVLEMAKHWIENSPKNELLKYTKITDYLRDNGYLLPYNYLTEKELIDYGWVKIKK